MKNDVMGDLITMIASVMPMETIIEKLQESTTEFKISGSDESKKHLAMYCHMFITRVVTDDKGVVKTIEDMRNIRNAVDVFTPAKQ